MHIASNFVAVESLVARPALRRLPDKDFKTLELSHDPKFVLTGLEIGLSSNCNFHCDYCCAYELNDRSLMTSRRAIEILESVDTLQRVKLSGGEVLIYFDECVRLIEYCTERGLQTQVNSNGSLLNAEKIARLETAGLGCLHVSYNFTRAAEFGAYYKQPEAMFHRIEENIRIAAASRLEVVTETVMFRSTQYRLPEIHHRVHALGVRKHEIQNGIPIEKNDWAEVLSGSEVEQAIENLVANRHPGVALYFSCIDIDPAGNFYPRVMELLTTQQIHFPSCIEGRNQLHIHSNGDVLICELGHAKVIGNVNSGTELKKLLDDKPPALVDFLERRNNDACSCVIRTLAQPAAAH